MATGLGWSYAQIGDITWWDALDIFDYWRSWPPTHELAAMAIGYEKPMTTEEKHLAGAMSPVDFMEHFRRTGGKVEGVTRQ